LTTVIFAGGGTGGHLFPALAVAGAVSVARPDWHLSFAGATRGVEATLLPARGLPHRLFPFEPIHRQAWWRNARWPALAWRIDREVDAWLDAEQPSAVIGTGGYVSGPVIWRAARRGIPTAVLELDALPGLATRLAARSASEIWLGTPEALAHLPGATCSRATVTGAPSAPPDRGCRPKAVDRFGIDGTRPVVVVTGGSQGAAAINGVVSAWLGAGGAEGRQVIWATGRGSHERFLARHHPPDVHVQGFIDPMAEAWSVADLVISRAGMSTLAELAAWGIPAIVIPLPTSAADHQSHNARAAAAAGAVVHLDQAELTPERLEAEVATLLGDVGRRERMAAAAAARGRPDAAEQIARRVIALAEGPHDLG
jgi:UDP-N-acetylglucosamine--N-acetylmuramyl-(pentapeptide) pyrophosphoryl-undecaprenol N-acetylglucosamine transferase